MPDPVTTFMWAFGIVTAILIAVFTVVYTHLSKTMENGLGKLQIAISGLETKMSGVETRLEAKISGLETKLEAKISGLETKLEAKIDGLSGQIMDLRVAVVALQVSVYGKPIMVADGRMTLPLEGTADKGLIAHDATAATGPAESRPE
jgi:predicted PurR-regulated permease PerM